MTNFIMQEAHEKVNEINMKVNYYTLMLNSNITNIDALHENLTK